MIKYEGAVKIAEQLRKYNKDFDYITVIFENKNINKLPNHQTTFFFDTNGDLIVSGKKK